MEKKMVKAIRLVNGFTDDLRITLDRSMYEYPSTRNNPQQEKIKWFLLENLLGIYGLNIYDMLDITVTPQPVKDARDYYRLLCFLDKEAWKICAGEYDSEK